MKELYGDFKSNYHWKKLYSHSENVKNYFENPSCAAIFAGYVNFNASFLRDTCRDSFFDEYDSISEGTDNTLCQSKYFKQY